MKPLTTEQRYQIYINRYVGFDTPKNNGSGETISGKRTMESFLCRKRVNNFLLADNTLYADKWLDEYDIPRFI